LSDIDLSQASFFHQAQYQHSQRLIAVPFLDLYQLGKELNGSIEQLVIIYSVGRCGSTLLSKIFGRVETVLSLSEPDVFAQIVAMRNSDGSSDREMARLLKTCLNFLCKPTSEGKYSCCVIKLRSFCIELADLIYQIFPDAKTLFMYRNLENVVKSSIPAFAFLSSMLTTIAQNIDSYSKFMPLLKDYAADVDFSDTSAIDLYTIMWLSVMQDYLQLYQREIVTVAIRYEDLIAEPQQMVSSIFEYCELPTSQVALGCQAFKEDAHRSSSLSKENIRQSKAKIPSIIEIRQKTHKLLKKHPKIKTSDFIVPGTLKVVG